MAPKGGNGIKDKAVAQYNADAGLLAEFEQSRVSGKAFDYARSVMCGAVSAPEEQIAAYLSTIQTIQRDGFTKPFGCLLVIDESAFRNVGYSENCFELLGLESKSGGSLIGVDAREIFTPSSGTSLAKAAASREVSLSNPVWVYSRGRRRPLYAILHRIDVEIIIDLEPARSSDPAISLTGVVQSQKLVVRMISTLQVLPRGDIDVLCDTLAEDVQKLTGYDRIMVYRFNEDEHDEVISEIRRSLGALFGAALSRN